MEKCEKMKNFQKYANGPAAPGQMGWRFFGNKKTYISFKIDVYA